MNVLIGARGTDWDIRAIPLTLAFMLGIASVGPLGVIGFPAKRQTAELKALMIQHDLLENGKIIPVQYGARCAES